MSSQIRNQVPLHVRSKAQQMGFNDDLISKNWALCQNDEYQFFNLLAGPARQTRLGQNYLPLKQYQAMETEDQNYQDALMQSMHSNKRDIINPEQRQRLPGVPVGLKNIGNTCYFNCLLQTYFDNIQFVQLVLQSKIDELPPLHNNASYSEQCSYKKKKLSQEMIRNLQKVFTLMIKSNNKYVDPQEILMNLTDDNGEYLQIGDQKDVGEFNCHFLSRISDGLEKNSKKPPMEMAQSQIFPQSSSFFDQHSQDSAIHARRPQRIVSENTLAKLYFGKIKNFISYLYGDQEKQIEKDEEFNFISLNLKHDSLSECWNDYFHDQIDDYRNERGDLVRAQKISFITQAPLYLFFQLQRVQYDSNQGRIVKNHSYLQFPKDLYIDKYLLENRKEYEQIKRNIMTVRIEMESKKKKLQDVIYQGVQNESILNHIQAIIDYIERPIDTSTEQQSQRSTRKVQSEIFVVNAKARRDVPKEQQNLLNQLKSFQSDLQKQKSALENEILQCQRNLDKAFGGFNKRKYLLSSILIHDGQEAESGHYYAYIYDFERNIWRKYDDTIVTEIDEQVVFQKSFGGTGKTSSAYFLMYSAEANVTSKNFKGPIHSHNIQNQQVHINQDLYSTFLKVDQLQYVQKLNNQFEIELSEYQSEQIVTSILDDYKIKYQAIQKMFQDLNPQINSLKIRPPSILNPCIYLQTSQQDEMSSQRDFFVKYLILQSAVKTIHPKKIQISEIRSHNQYDSFYAKLESMMKRENRSDVKYPETMLLNKQESQYLDQILDHFQTSLGYAASLMYIYESAYSKNSKFCLISLDYYAQLAQKEKSNNFFYVQKIQLLKYIPSIVLREVEKNNFSEQINKQLLELVTAIVVKYYRTKEFEHLKLQISIWIKDVGEKSKKLSEVADHLISNIEESTNTEPLTELLNQNIDDLNIKTKEMSEKHDLYNWSPVVTEDLFIKCIQNFQTMFDTNYYKVVMFVETIIKNGLIMERNEREKFLK